MFRLLGFLVGSVAAILMLLLLLGVPDFHLADATDDQQRFEAAVEKLREKQQEKVQPADPVADDVVARTKDVTHDIDTAAIAATAAADAGTDTSSAAAPAVQMPPETPAPMPPQAAAEIAPADEVPAMADELQWYSFWNPFRSEIAASGFVSRLEEVTGLDYRVVKVRTGVYEVAFAYADDAEKRDKLNRIALATGLDLPGS